MFEQEQNHFMEKRDSLIITQSTPFTRLRPAVKDTACLGIFAPLHPARLFGKITLDIQMEIVWRDHFHND